MISASSRPADWAAAIRCWLSREYSSCARRLIPYRLATFSAVWIMLS
jgi:hypothetical protein